jgi:hypothetical protein
MRISELGSWDPLPVGEAVHLFNSATFRWWLSGGCALEAHVGRSWRPHDDTDIGIVRAATPQLAGLLEGWDIHIGAGGTLVPWDGRPLDPDRSENNLWCRRSPSGSAQDDIDAAVVIPELDPTRREWLASHLSADHVWHRRLTERP